VPNTVRSRNLILLAGWSGTLLEWYDFYIFGAAAALVFNKLFFPSLRPSIGILASYASYAVGFVIRPLGGVLVAYIGDTLGRKPALILTLALMGLSTTAIGLLPTYHQVGLLAPALLILLRVLQGLGTGGEFAGAMLMIAESAGPKKGFWGSFTAVAIDFSVITSSSCFAIFAALPANEFLAWGWRVPFLLSAPILLVGWIVRKKIEETAEYLAYRDHGLLKPRLPFLDIFTKWPSRISIGLGVNAIMNVGYIYQVFIIGFLVQRFNLRQSQALFSLIIASCVSAAAAILFGWLSDKVGRKPIMLFGAIFTFFYSIPFFMLVESGNVITVTLALTLGLALGLRPVLSVQPAFYAELFPVDIRYTGITISREFTSAIFGGPLPFLAAWLSAKTAHFELWIGAVMMALASFTGAAVFLAPRHSERINRVAS
jgi:MHS family shikimate/dehydroshikimate transporter-like MFS transporter